MKKGWKWAGRLLGVFFTLILLAGFCFTLIIAQPQPDPDAAPSSPAPALSPSPALKIDSESQRRDLIRSFPAPVMSFMSGSGMVFVSGESQDMNAESGLARRLSLYWQTPDGQPLILQSIYPASTLDLLGRGRYSFSGTAGPALFGLPSVRMEDGANIRLHVQAEGTGLYVLTLPSSLGSSLSGIARSIQLFSAD